MSVRRALVFSFAQRYTNILLTLPTIMIVSRLLTPAEVGVFSVGMAFVGLIHALRDFGVTDYLVQVSDVKEDVAKTAFTINVVISWCLALIVFLLSDLAAWFYDESGLATLIKIFSINFLLLPFGTTVHAMLKRASEFGIIYKINLIQQTTQSGTTVLLAFLGFGYIGLGLGSLAGLVAMVIACVTLGRVYRIGGIGLREWRNVASFGLQRTSTGVVQQIGGTAPDFIIGRVLDFAAVGLFSRGQGLINMFQNNVLSAIKVVTYPSYARAHRSAGNAHLLYFKSKQYTTAISWPFLGFSALMAFPIMRIVFGDQWDAAVPLLQIFAIAGMIGSINLDASQLLVAIGRVGTITKIVTVVQSIRISLILVAAFHSLEAVALVQILSATLAASLYQSSIVRYTGMTKREFVDALKDSFATTLCALIVPILVMLFFAPSAERLWSPLIISGLGAVAGWWLGLKLSRHPLGEEIDSWIAQAYRRLRSRPR